MNFHATLLKQLLLLLVESWVSKLGWLDFNIKQSMLAILSLVVPTGADAGDTCSGWAYEWSWCGPVVSWIDGSFLRGQESRFIDSKVVKQVVKTIQHCCINFSGFRSVHFMIFGGLTGEQRPGQWCIWVVWFSQYSYLVSCYFYKQGGHNAMWLLMSFSGISIPPLPPGRCALPPNPPHHSLL